MEDLESAISYLQKYLQKGDAEGSFRLACRWASGYVIDPFGRVYEKTELALIPITRPPDHITSTHIKEWVEAAKLLLALHRLQGKLLPEPLQKALDNRPTVPID